MSDEALKQKYPSMFEGGESKSADIGELEDTPVQDLPHKLTGENALPVRFRGSGQSEGKEYYKKQRLEQFDEDARASSLPDWLISGLREKMRRAMSRSHSIFDVRDNPEFTFKAMLGSLSVKFPDYDGMDRRSEKYPSMGSTRERIEEYLTEDVSPLDSEPGEEATEE